MLKANKNHLFELLFSIYNRNLLKRRFNSLSVSGLQFSTIKIPKLFYANHSSWWDGLIAFEISRTAKIDSFVMMEDKHLRNLFLFRMLGAFSVNRENPRQSLESINYAADLFLEKSNRAVWIFPQGEILPNDFRPLRFYSGAARLVKKLKECAVIPVAFRYEFLGDFKPEIFVIIGKPEFYTSGELHQPKILTLNFEKKLTALLDEIKNDIMLNETTKYVKIF